ncbi:MAG TPA: hypothetical protein VH208_01065 [Myxococcaceae bacterium]|nr:hypothetical protein [Myxococcaceae bacterium]
MSTPDRHPTPWRVGRKLHHTAMGPVPLYDGCPEGDGGEPGHFIGTMFSSELARRVVAAVNESSRLYHVQYTIRPVLPGGPDEAARSRWGAVVYASSASEAVSTVRGALIDDGGHPAGADILDMTANEVPLGVAFVFPAEPI